MLLFDIQNKKREQGLKKMRLTVQWKHTSNTCRVCRNKISLRTIKKKSKLKQNLIE